MGHEELEICPACGQIMALALGEDYEEEEQIEVKCPHCKAVGIWTVQRVTYFVASFEHMKGE